MGWGSAARAADAFAPGLPPAETAGPADDAAERAAVRWLDEAMAPRGSVARRLELTRSGGADGAARLAEFLAARGATPEMLRGEVSDAFGEPLLVVATGSLVHGFGNARSDVDMNVVVDHDGIALLPIPSHAHGVLHDVTYFGASDIGGWVETLDEPWPPVGDVGPAGWRAMQRKLFHCVRFGYGLPLSARDGWDGWTARLREESLTRRVVGWWRGEAVRARLAARWLADAKPLLAAQRHCEAVCAALESRVAAAGELYFGSKWLPEKLRRLEDADGLGALREALRVPTRASEAARYAARCDEVVDALLAAEGGDRGLAGQLWAVPGLTTNALTDRVLVSRWNLRGVELREPLARELGSGEPLWEGPAGGEPDPALLMLFVEDMAWLSIVAETG